MKEIFEIFPIAMAVCGADGDVLFANVACRELLETMGIPNELSRILPDRYRAIVRHVVNGGGVQEFDQRHGSHFLHFIFRASEDASHAYIFVRDVTAQEEAKAQLIQSEKMASLGLLIAGLAHDFNTPLGAIHSNNDILFRSVAKIRELLGDALRESPDSPQYTDATRIMGIVDEVCANNAAATERLMNIVGNLKNFARLDEAERKPVNIHEGLDSTLTLVQHLLRNRIEVVKRYGDLPAVECFPNRLNQVFMNLLVNATQAIPDRGTITITTFVADDAVKISIADTGVGIPPENLSKIFDPGFTTKGVGVGTGLGLSICYKIVKDHGGNIDAESGPGGTTFTISLPLTRPNEVSHVREGISDNSVGR